MVLSCRTPGSFSSLVSPGRESVSILQGGSEHQVREHVCRSSEHARRMRSADVWHRALSSAPAVPGPRRARLCFLPVPYTRALSLSQTPRIKQHYWLRRGRIEYYRLEGLGEALWERGLQPSLTESVGFERLEPSHPLGWPLRLHSERQKMTSVGSDVEKLESLCTVGGSVKRCNHYET